MGANLKQKLKGFSQNLGFTEFGMVLVGGGLKTHPIPVTLHWMVGKELLPPFPAKSTQVWHRDEDLASPGEGLAFPHQQVLGPFILSEKWLNPGSNQKTLQCEGSTLKKYKY